MMVAFFTQPWRAVATRWTDGDIWERIRGNVPRQMYKVEHRAHLFAHMAEFFTHVLDDYGPASLSPWQTSFHFLLIWTA
jgi:hypothetical protein